MADYFSKRFLRVYPLFALSAVVLALLPDEDQNLYYNTHKMGRFNLFDMFTIQAKWRYQVYWTLPLEISYYFLIPVFAVAMVKLRRLWWLPILPLYGWIVYEGVMEFRASHSPLMPHLPTFVSGSLAAIIYVKADTFMREQSITLTARHKVLTKVIQCAVLGLIISISTKGAYFRWFFKSPVLEGPSSFPFSCWRCCLLERSRACSSGVRCASGARSASRSIRCTPTVCDLDSGYPPSKELDRQLFV